jgi:hypothetical protein
MLSLGHVNVKAPVRFLTLAKKWFLPLHVSRKLPVLGRLRGQASASRWWFLASPYIIWFGRYHWKAIWDWNDLQFFQTLGAIWNRKFTGSFTLHSLLSGVKTPSSALPSCLPTRQLLHVATKFASCSRINLRSIFGSKQKRRKDRVKD